MGWGSCGFGCLLLDYELSDWDLVGGKADAMDWSTLWSEGWDLVGEEIDSIKEPKGGEFINITNNYELKYSMNFNSLIQLKVSFKSLRGECFQVPID